MNAPARIFLDTNVLVYLFDEDSPAKQARARQIFAEHARTGDIVLSPQVLQEFYVTVTRKLARPLSPAAAQAAVTHLSTFPLVPVDGATILRAIHLHQAATLSFWDALIVQAALEGNCKRLLSEDLQHGRRFGELVVEDPFGAVWSVSEP
jgi:predicted nucleic acid-binding protein